MSNKMTVAQVIERHRAAGRCFKVDGVQSFAQDQGTGEAVLCLHGVPTSSFLYREVVPALAAEGFRAVAIDLPGLGLADRPRNFDYTFPNFARYCARAATELGLDKYHLVVHDVGGPIGFALAAENREKILSLTILNTWIDVDTFEKPLPMRPFEVPVVGEAELAAITHPTWLLAFSTLAVSDTQHIPREEIYAYVDLLKREDGGKAFLQIMRNFDKSVAFRELCYRAVQNVPYPVQAIWGAEDPGLRFERYGREIEAAADLRVMVKLPAKHLLQEDKWAEIAQQIAWLARQPASGAAPGDAGV